MTDRIRFMDIFSGCGGLSLGFELARRGPRFENVMSIDFEPDAVRVLNGNHATVAPSSGNRGPGRIADLTNFGSTTEVRAFYLWNLALRDGNRALTQRLQTARVPDLMERVTQRDRAYFRRVAAHQRRREFQEAVKAVPPAVRGSTMFRTFLNRFQLPALGAGFRGRPSILWSNADPSDDTEPVARGNPVPRNPDLERRLQAEWNAAIDHLRDNVARKAEVAALFLDSEEFKRLGKIGLDWRIERASLILDHFGVPDVVQEISAAYLDDHPLEGMIGAPPCQGFSNAGRSRINGAFREDRHTLQDEEHGDQRNALFRTYLMFLEALQPVFFVFENVPNFQSDIRLRGDRSVNMERMLRFELDEIRQLPYVARSFSITASRFGLPQRRLRYLLVGFRKDANGAKRLHRFAESLRARQHDHETPSCVAFDGLHQADAACGAAVGYVEHGSRESPEVRVSSPLPGDYREPARSYVEFIRMEPNGTVVERVRDHWARRPNPDDVPFFDALSPGARWSDIPDLEAVLRGINEDHHLLRGKYLSKASAAHKDWLSRIDPNGVCRTICAHLAKDGYAYVHPLEPRTISVREAARIQGFPDWFAFRGVSMSSAFRMIGNAFPPFVARAIGESVAEAIAGLDPPENVDTRPAGENQQQEIVDPATSDPIGV